MLANMWTFVRARLAADPYGSVALVRRLLVEDGRRHAKGYTLAVVLMGITAVCTAFSAYLIGSIVNQAYVNRSFAGVAAICIASFLIYTVKGLAAYGQAVVMARIGNGITAANQRRLFDTLLQASVGYFANRHSSEFIAR